MRSTRLIRFHLDFPKDGGLRHWLVRQVVGGGCFLLGLVLILPGVPGPGGVLLLVSLLVMHYPGKPKFVKWLATQRFFRHTRVYLRRRCKVLLIVPKSARKMRDIPYN